MYGCVPVQTLTILEVNQASDGLIDLAMSMEDFISHDPTKTGIVHGFWAVWKQPLTLAFNLPVATVPPWNPQKERVMKGT